MKPEILFEDKDIIVCLKPAGIATQTKRTGAADMVSILKNHIALNEKKKHAPYLAVIHRLDQPVTGLLVFAKTPAAARNLNMQLANSGFGKHYLAWLSNIPSQSEGHLSDYLIKDAKANTSRICTPDTPGAKKAVLYYKIVETRPPYALAEITLETGRHHQIRVQMANIGCPIIEDKKYGGASYAAASKFLTDSPDSPFLRSENRALQLYAFRLTFLHPRTGKIMEFQRNVF